MDRPFEHTRHRRVRQQRLRRPSAARELSRCGRGGNTDAVPTTLTTDFERNARVCGTDADRGAYEPAFHDRLFVDENANGLGTGFTWEDVSSSLLSATQAETAGEIRIARGTYVVGPQGETLKSHTRLRGGYNANNGNQNPANNPVVLTGDLNGDDLPSGVNRDDNATHVLVADGAMDVTIESVAIRGVNVSGTGGGIRLVDATDAQIIEDNDAGSGAGA